MRVEVTREDVERGRPCGSGECPVALAVKRAVGREYVAVSREYVLIGVVGRLARCVGLPFDVGERIALFDRTGEMEPFGFELPWEETTS